MATFLDHTANPYLNIDTNHVAGTRANKDAKLFAHHETHMTKICSVLFGCCKMLKALYQRKRAYAA
jgi:hypothetical protein